jgi:hypothetical protein
VLAAFMLAVFAFSITPKILLHNFVANHKDTPFTSNFEKTAQFHKAGFNCSCDNLVVESPFTDDFSPVQITVQTFFPSRIARDINNFRNGYHFYLTLRGPPAFYTA